MISMDPPGHVPIRKLSGKLFVPSRVNALQDKVNRIANALIDDIIARHGSEVSSITCTNSPRCFRRP